MLFSFIKYLRKIKAKKAQVPIRTYAFLLLDNAYFNAKKLFCQAKILDRITFEFAYKGDKRRPNDLKNHNRRYAYLAERSEKKQALQQAPNPITLPKATRNAIRLFVPVITFAPCIAETKPTAVPL